MQKKGGLKLILSLILIVILVIIAFIFYKYFTSPYKKIGIGAEIENFTISEDGKTAYVKLIGGSFVNVTKIKFTFIDNSGKEHYYETTEGIQEIEVPFERNFWQWFFGQPTYKGRFDYSINSEDAGFENFFSIEDIKVNLEYETSVLPISITQNQTGANRTANTSGGGGGGGGGGGRNGDNGCAPKTCIEIGKCGIWQDSCGGEIDCGYCGNLIKNPGFEQGFENWTKRVHETGRVSNDSRVTEGCFEGKCIRMQNINASAHYFYQDIGNLRIGEEYVFSAWFKTNFSHYGYFLFKDLDWRNASCGLSYKASEPNSLGTNQWKRVVWFSPKDFIPDIDGCGNSVENHTWRVYLYYYTNDNQSVYYDNISLMPKREFLELEEDFLENYLPPLGCENNAESKCLDFGEDEATAGIKYNTNSMTTEIGTDGNISYRAINPKNTTEIKIPEFNTEGALGLPKTPMLLEIKFKDTINDSDSVCNSYSPSSIKTDHRAFIKSKIDYNRTDNNFYGSYSLPEYEIAYLGEKSDGKWKIMQYAFQKSPFQLIRAINGNFTFKIAMPNKCVADNSLYLPIDYISLRAISQEKYDEITSKKIWLYNFYEVELPPDEPSSLPAYNPEIEVFARDIMMPVYNHTKPKQEEIAKATSGIASFSALGEIEPVSFAIYSKNGIQNLNVEVSDLTNGAKKIPKENILTQQVVYDTKRTSPYFNKEYTLIPDRLEDFSELDVSAGTSKRIWLKIKVPENIDGGVYNGNIVIKQGSLVKKTIPISLNVLPIKLNLSENLNLVYGDPFVRFFSNNISKIFEFYRETGFDPFIYSNYPQLEPIINRSDKRIIVGYNTTKFESNIDRMIKEGFLKEKAFVETSYMWPRVYYDIFGKSYTSSDPKMFYYELSNQTFVDAFSLAIKNYTDIAKARNITFAYSSVDEPGNSVEKMIIAERIFTIIKNNSANTTVTYYNPCEGDWNLTSGRNSEGYIISPNTKGYVVPNNTIPSLKNLVDYKVWAPSYQGEGYRRGYENYGYYTTSTSYLRNPIYNRFLHGLLAFRTDAKAVSAYAMGDYINDPFNDFDAQAIYIYPFTYPDFLFAYPTWDGKLIPTMAAEGIREGIKDAKYIATLKELIKNSPGTTANEAQVYLDSIRSRIDANYWSTYPGKTTQFGYSQFILRNISDSKNPNDFEAFTNIRANISEYIVRLSDIKTETIIANEEILSSNPLTKILNWIKGLLTIKTGRAITGNTIRNLTGF